MAMEVRKFKATTYFRWVGKRRLPWWNLNGIEVRGNQAENQGKCARVRYRYVSTS